MIIKLDVLKNLEKRDSNKNMTLIFKLKIFINIIPDFSQLGRLLKANLKTRVR